MKSKGNVVFLGMMGSGKSSIGFLVSKKLKLELFDIDKLIEKKIDMKISQIFKIKGEEFFRNLEEKITLKILKKNNVIISLGGGAFLNDKIRKEVLDNHMSFWLKWSSEVLIKRIRNNLDRPLTYKASDNELVDLIKKRSNIYTKALYEIKCDELTKNDIVKKVLKIYETY